MRWNILVNGFFFFSKEVENHFAFNWRKMFSTRPPALHRTINSISITTITIPLHSPPTHHHHYSHYHYTTFISDMLLPPPPPPPLLLSLSCLHKILIVFHVSQSNKKISFIFIVLIKYLKK